MTLKPLSPGKYEDIQFPFLENETFRRTGIPENGSAFFHALLFSNNTFRSKTDEEKYDAILDFRKELLKDLMFDDWIQHSNSLSQIIDMIRISIYMIPALLENTEELEKLKSYNINIEYLNLLFELIPPMNVDKNIVSIFEREIENITEITEKSLIELFENTYKTFIIDRINELEENVETKWTESKRSCITMTFTEMSNRLFQFILDKTFQEFLNEIETFEKPVPLLNILELYNTNFQEKNNNLFKNIIIINAITNEPMNNFDFEWDENKDYSILLYFPDFHFEHLSRIVNMDNKKNTAKIQRFIQSNDPIIESLIV